MEIQHKKRVGILRGGMGEDYTSSLSLGADLISHIIENLADKYKVLDILVDRGGVWHINGIETPPAELMHRVDVVWNTSHSNASTILKQFSIPTICETSFAHGIGGHREFLQKHIEDLDIRMPRHIIFPLYQIDFDGPIDEYAEKKAREVFQKFAGPWVVRTLTHDISAGVHVAKTLPELAQAIEDILIHKKSILVEELIAGQVVPVHSLRGFRGEEVYTLPLGKLSVPIKEKLEHLAKNLHQYFGEHTYMKSNFLLTPRGKIYLTGVFFHPNVKKTSHLANALESVGAKMHHFIEYMIEKVS